MKLLTEELKKKLPPLYSGEEKGLKAFALVKFFTPDSNWTWYASEASALMRDGTYKALGEVDMDDPEIQDVLFFGLVDGFEIELGYFSLNELQSARGALGLPIKRDLWFKPALLSELLEQHSRSAAV